MSELKEMAVALAKWADVTKPIVETGTKLIDNLLGKPCLVLGEMLADQVYAFQWGIRLRIAAKAAEKLKGRQIPAGVLPKGFLLPLLEACGNCEEEVVQDMWAELLAKGVQSADGRHPLFIETLRRLAGADACLLDAICRNDPLETKEG